MNYLNEKCPVCDKPFAAQDDVVVCPECGAPHHRACWHAQGACAFAASHGTGYVWTATASEQTAQSETQQQTNPELRCPRCGEPCGVDTLVCPTCGNRLGVVPPGNAYAFNEDYFMRGVDVSAQTDLDGMTAKEAAIFVQQRAGTYVRKFQKQTEKGKKVGWNWAAFLFSPFWFFYRKAYKAGVFFLGLWMILSAFLFVPLGKVVDQTDEIISQYITIDETVTLEKTAQEFAALDTAAQQTIQQAAYRLTKAVALFYTALLLPNVFAAMFADYLYKKKVVKDVQTMRDFAQNEQTFKMLALRRGGVSIFGLLACYFLQMMYQNLLLYLS